MPGRGAWGGPALRIRLEIQQKKREFGGQKERKHKEEEEDTVWPPCDKKTKNHYEVFEQGSKKSNAEPGERSRLRK